MSRLLKNWLALITIGLIIIAALSYQNKEYLSSFFFSETAPALPQQGDDAPIYVEDATTAEDMPTNSIQHNCILEGTVLEGNQKFFATKNRLVAVIANQSTFDESLGESHRLLVVQNTENCESILEQTLPVNFSPDYPYYLTKIDSVKGELVGIIGVDKFYVYDIANNVLSAPLKPTFKGERYMEDAQSGAIVSLEPWGRYVIGYAQDQGMFAYNMTIARSPKQINPVAEFEQPNESYSTLFLLSMEAQNDQALVPQYDANNKKMELNPLIETAQGITQQTTKRAGNRRYVILRLNDKTKTPVAVDMQTGKRIELPEDLTNSNDTAIEAWLAKRK
ncbi:MAG: hypothetical protein HC912_01935 [Saprospiraceae bacterium]|nr:hypothetical protein [Saprospiraceae bacterium]